MRKVALAGYVLVVLAFAVFVARPALTRGRDIPAAITSPPALQVVSIVDLRPGRTLCMNDLAIDPRARQARFRAGSFRKPGPPLSVTVRGPGYTSRAAIPAGWPDNATLTAPVRRPPGQELVTACIANRGKVKIGLYAAGDRAMSRSQTHVGATNVGLTPQFGFWEGKPASIWSHAGVIAERIAIFRGPLGHAWIVWVLLVLSLVAVPVGFGYVAWRAFSDER
jgi:hypothetical protein